MPFGAVIKLLTFITCILYFYLLASQSLNFSGPGFFNLREKRQTGYNLTYSLNIIYTEVNASEGHLLSEIVGWFGFTTVATKTKNKKKVLSMKYTDKFTCINH